MLALRDEKESAMTLAEKIRVHGREKYVSRAKERGQARFAIRAGDVVHDLGVNGRVPAVCSALRTNQFLKENGLRLVEITGPKSGQSTTVTFTYEFINKASRRHEGDAWSRLRGALKDVFSEVGGGEAYLRSERGNFRRSGEHE
jgi:hypothetical protein